METLEERIQRKLHKKQTLIKVARGQEKADVAIKNARYLNVFSSTWEEGDIAVSGGLIAGIGGKYEGRREIDARGRYVIPGLIDAHIHLESAIVAPPEFARIALRHGTTTVVTAVETLGPASSPSILTKSTVASDALAMFTMLLPIRIVESSVS